VQGRAGRVGLGPAPMPPNMSSKLRRREELPSEHRGRQGSSRAGEGDPRLARSRDTSAVRIRVSGWAMQVRIPVDLIKMAAEAQLGVEASRSPQDPR
jgi:hypothetical protein